MIAKQGYMMPGEGQCGMLAVNAGGKYLRRRGLMSRYGISEATLDRHLKAGLLPAPDKKLGNAPLWDVGRLDAWDAEHLAIA